ncbi:rhodanese-like domain-containing protein [Salinimonas chungwhensis]|uniref:rhodanese-like domain-containing protein n=1 Tax=Salinimonas chungwhensis TaxID=265425 RepID=UPI00036B0237|nr:rhodanese-like domain-containing protein [Salinimonas chungwhensis]
MKSVITFTILIILMFLSGCDSQAVQAKPVAQDTASFLMKKVQNDEWLLIDVRSPQEFAQGHIPGAINMPHNEITVFIEQLEGEQPKPIVVYCRSGRRAMLAAEILKKNNFPDVRHLEGDMMGWSAAGLPIDRM